jgi:hypothetical protein
LYLRGGLIVGPSRSPLLADTVEKLDFLPRSQFLKQQASFKKKGNHPVSAAG